MSRPGWTLTTATVLCAGYAIAHLIWAVTGTPGFMAAGESFFAVPVWVPALPAALAAAACLLINRGRRTARPAWTRWLIVVGGFAAGSTLIAYCFLFFIGMAMLLMVPFGVPLDDGGLFLLRTVGVAAGGLTLVVCREEFRRVWKGCDLCGRRHGRSPERRTDATPWWGYAGAYLAVSGLLARIIGGLPQLTGEEFPLTGPGGVGFKVFEGGMLLAGTLLPLALAHRWGRIWPGWVRPLAGRPVPRWVVLGPGLFMGIGLSMYFGVGGISAMATGQEVIDLVIVLDIGGYTAWGVGLLIASASYYHLTKPACPHAAPPDSEALRPHAPARGHPRGA